jgi:hypothetical protein
MNKGLDELEAISYRSNYLLREMLNRCVLIFLKPIKRNGEM